jgi:hypothetical protein
VRGSGTQGFDPNVRADDGYRTLDARSIPEAASAGRKEITGAAALGSHTQWLTNKNNTLLLNQSTYETAMQKPVFYTFHSVCTEAAA